MNRREVRRIVLEVLARHQFHLLNNQDTTAIWREVFRLVYGGEPRNDEDPRWDKLLVARDGYRAMHFVHLYERLCRLQPA